MPIEKIQLVLQIISVVGVPILTAFIAWITNSLRKTNTRIDDLRDEVRDGRKEDAKELAKMSEKIEGVAVSQEHILEGQKRTNMQFNRLQEYLLKSK